LELGIKPSSSSIATFLALLRTFGFVEFFGFAVVATAGVYPSRFMMTMLVAPGMAL
jgi:hypothetical protein